MTMTEIHPTPGSVAHMRDTIAAAKKAADAAALRVWERDGKRDGGSCGGAMCEFYKRPKIVKELIAAGLADNRGDVWLQLRLPDEIRSQNADIPDAMHAAFLDVLRAAGYGDCIKRAWNYTD